MTDRYQNALTVWNAACGDEIRDGLQWYGVHREWTRELADRTNTPVATVACIVAVLSPQCPWQKNIVCATELLSLGMVKTAGPYGSNILKAHKVLEEKITDTRAVMPHGPKVWNFSRNLMGDTEAVTIDTHMVQLLDHEFVPHGKKVGWRQYGNYLSPLRELAADLHLRPCDLQAILWLTWKRLHPPEAKRERMRRETWNETPSGLK